MVIKYTIRETTIAKCFEFNIDTIQLLINAPGKLRFVSEGTNVTDQIFNIKMTM